MVISVFGLGYVGAVTSACLARDGHRVIGVDVNPEKVSLIAAGRSPIFEPGLNELLSAAVRSGRLTATVNSAAAVSESGLSLISVGTPASANGTPDLSHVFNVCREIGMAVARNQRPHAVVLRSTVPPGTLDRCTNILQETAQGIEVRAAFNPEFLREGTAIRDFDHPPYTVIGTDDAIAERAVREIYAKVDAPVVVVPAPVAELVKQVSNAWHATKISFANEIGRVAKAFGVDGRKVMDLMTQDAKLNVSVAYLRPGFAYGGSCLPKDLSALVSASRMHDVAVPLLRAVSGSNEQQIELAAREVLKHGRRVALLGLAFKPGTDDLRESPMVHLVKRLLGEGCKVRIYDKAVQQAHLIGTNLAYIHNYLPHFEALLVAQVEEAVRDAEVIVLAHLDSALREPVLKAPASAVVVDLAGLFSERPERGGYHALGW
jgi:GDP-mannose 6-dehydrogenase